MDVISIWRKCWINASERLLSRPCHVFDLALVVALLAEIAAVEELGLDLFQGQSTASGVFRPRHISAVKIAAVDRIRMKFFERLDVRALFASALACARLLSPTLSRWCCSSSEMRARNSEACE